MNPILTNEEVGILTVFDGLHHIETPLLADYIRAIEQAVLNKLNEQEPVAWLQTSVEDGVDTVIARTHKPDKFNAEWWRFDPLFTNPAPSVPEGYQLVPIEPTVNQIVAGQDSGSIENSKRIVRIYKAMLAAARSK